MVGQGRHPNGTKGLYASLSTPHAADRPSIPPSYASRDGFADTTPAAGRACLGLHANVYEDIHVRMAAHWQGSMRWASSTSTATESIRVVDEHHSERQPTSPPDTPPERPPTSSTALPCRWGAPASPGRRRSVPVDRGSCLTRGEGRGGGRAPHRRGGRLPHGLASPRYARGTTAAVVCPPFAG